MTWDRIQRVGKVKVKAAEGNAEVVTVEFTTAPSRQPDEWVAYFEQKAVEFDLNVSYYGWGMDGDSGTLRARRDDFEGTVALLDQALEFANEQYEQNDLPSVEAAQQNAVVTREAAEARQAELDARAAKLERPDPKHG